MSIREDVFGLEQVYRLQIEGLWSPKSNVWLAPSPYYGPAPDVGYFGAGNSSIVDRIDYSNDTATASVRGPLSLSQRLLGATGNSSYGYFGAGFIPGAVSTVDRIDYTNDIATTSVRGPLSLSKYGPAATGNSSYGYFGGGAPGPRSTIDRIDYSNDTATASVRGPLSLARGYLSATSAAANGLPQ